MIRCIYLSGPMTGLPDLNYPAFHAQAARLRALGFNVENPAENPEQETWQEYMRWALAQMLTCDTIALLPGWVDSRGATLERYIAGQIGMRIVLASQIVAKEQDLCPA